MYVNELSIRTNDKGVAELVSDYETTEKKSFWVALITGKDEKFGLKRSFLNLSNDAQGLLKAGLKDGIYEFYCKGRISGIPVRGFVKISKIGIIFATTAGELDPQYKLESKSSESSPLYGSENP